ncbi:L-amino-acid oxidase [Fusarium oxysporum f. sp. albedinis]|nr:L-amino-acid oxidase [Fusarium oxysporum f. sp. albedinis]
MPCWMISMNTNSCCALSLKSAFGLRIACNLYIVLRICVKLGQQYSRPTTADLQELQPPITRAMASKNLRIRGPLVSWSSYSRSHIHSTRDRYLNAGDQLRRTRPQAAQSKTSSNCMEGESCIQTHPLLAEDMEKYAFDQTTFASLQISEQASRNLLGQCLPADDKGREPCLVEARSICLNDCHTESCKKSIYPWKCLLRDVKMRRQRGCPLYPQKNHRLRPVELWNRGEVIVPAMAVGRFCIISVHAALDNLNGPGTPFNV